MYRIAIAFTLTVGHIELAMAQTDQSSQGPWWVGHLITALAAVLGAMMIVWQIGRQRRNEIEAQRENYKIELRLRVYQEFSERIASACDALGKAGMYAFCIPMHMELARQGSSLNGSQPVADRVNIFMDLDTKAQSELADTVILIEKYLIIHPDLDIFRMALSSAAHDLRAAFPSLFEFMLHNFPMDIATNEGQRTTNIKAFSQEECERVGVMAMEYHERTSDAQSFMTDIQTELQHLFLGVLFPNRPPKRTPADPSKRVLSLDPASIRSLRQHFLKGTEWGKSVVATSMDVHRHFQERT